MTRALRLEWTCILKVAFQVIYSGTGITDRHTGNCSHRNLRPLAKNEEEEAHRLWSRCNCQLYCWVTVLLSGTTIGSTVSGEILCPYPIQGGVDLFEIFDSYAGGFSVLFPAVAELIIVMWVYGVSRFVGDVNRMLKTNVSLYWR